MLSDTHPDAERVQIDLLRQTTPEQRLCKVASLTNALIDSSRQTIAAQNPTLSPKALSVRCVELYYGEALAARFQEYLETPVEEDHAAP
jgi:hypothetical protein